MKRITICFCLITFLFFPDNILLSQNLKDLEKKFIDLQNSYSKEKIVLDSMKHKFNLRINEINIEKSKSNPDKEKITSLMANSVNMSNSLEQQQTKTDKLIRSIEEIKKELNEKYADVIDSLKNVRRNKGNNEEVENLILYYAAKRLEVIPGLDRLSFNPGKILEFDLSRSTNAVDKKVLQEYLESALGEVNKMLTEVNKESNDINQIIELQRKASKFIEETEFESGIISGRLSQTKTNTEPENAIPATSRNDGISYNENAVSNISKNVEAYEHLLEQLNTIKSLSVRQTDEATGTINQSIDLYSYGSLLKEVKRRLMEYKKLLEQKIGSFK